MNSDAEPAAFFPPLASLLAGSSRLISFHTVLDAFAVAPQAAAENERLEKFCYDPPTFNLLATCPESLPRASTKSKADFDARTAPIQVSGSQNGDYDLEQMKKDALELSAQLGVEESLALRVVVLEWQSRAEEQLRSGSDDVGRAAELGVSTLGKSLTGLDGSANGARPATDFQDSTIRRRRQLALYLQERSARLKLGANLLGCYAVRDKPGEAKTWVDDLARQVFKECFGPDRDNSSADAMFDKTMTALEEHIQALDDNTKLPKIAQETEETVLMYAAASFNDIVSTMRVLLVAMHTRTDILSSSRVLKWFHKLEAVNYFLTLPPSLAWPDPTELQSLVSLLSVMILNPCGITSNFWDLEPPRAGDVTYPRLDSGNYVEDETCLSELSLIFYRAALNDISILSPALLAWTIIIIPIRNVAHVQAESRERLLENGSSDNENPRRRSSARKDSRLEMSLFEKLYASLQSVDMEPEVKDDPTAWFARVSTQAAFGVVGQLSASVSSAYRSILEQPMQQIARTQLFDLLKAGMPLTYYDGEVLEAVLAVLKPDSASGSESCDAIDDQLCSRFIQDDTLRRDIFDQALARYPFELSPTVLLLSSLASARDAVHGIIELLENVETFTIIVPEHFNDYTLENEEENSNEVRIEQDLHLFVSRQALAWYGPDRVKRRALTAGSEGESERRTNATVIPAGTIATVLRESRPMVFKLNHPHSVLEYLGLLLSTRLPNSEMCVEPNQPSLDPAMAAEIIALVNALMIACSCDRRGEQESRFVLQRLSEALPDEIDVTNIVTELLESELVAHIDQTVQDGSLDLLIACAEFLALYIKVDAGRVWTALAQSSLLGLNGGTNALAAVVNTIETTIGQFRFLVACTSIYSNLVHDAVGGLVKRKPTEQPVKRGRFDSPIEHSEYTPERTMQRVLCAYTGVMFEVWESLPQWRFVSAHEKARIAVNICESFSLLIRATYGLQPEDSALASNNGGERSGLKTDRRLGSVLIPTAEAILDSYAPISNNATSMRSFIATFASAATVLQGFLGPIESTAQVSALQPVIELLTSIIRVARMGRRSEKSRGYRAASQLIKATSQLAIIFAQASSLRGSIASLLTEVTIALHNSEDTQSEPPSLFGHLSTSSAKAFLVVLAQLDRPLCEVATECQIWRFLEAIMRGRQQRLALYLLTGTVPREWLSASPSQEQSGRSLLAYALTQLSRIEELAPERSIALLGFVSAAQGASIWAVNEVRSHATFLKSITDWLDNLQRVDTKGNKNEQVLRTRELRMAGLICEVLAQAVHMSIEVGDQNMLKMLENKLTFLSTNGHIVDAHNRSLHLNLRDNFRARFGGVEVDAFHCSPAGLSQGHAVEGAYDLKIMDLALGHEWAWVGSTDCSGKSTGFRDEAARANVNFGLLQAQRGLLRAWSVLATTLAEGLDAVPDESIRTGLRTPLAQAVKNSLEASAAANLDVPSMDKILIMRAEMSFVILSKLVSGGHAASTPETKAILPAAHRALRASPADFDVATQVEDLQYYRLGLQILVLAVQIHLHPSSSTAPPANPPTFSKKATDETTISFLDPAIAGGLADVVTGTVAPAWRALSGNLHTNIACAMPADFALVSALLQAVLAVPGVAVAYIPMAEAVAAWQLVRSALSLYSWADRLAEATGDGDPIYGELAIQFLRVLSTIKPAAEHIALEGALPAMASANLSSYLRKPGGKTPFDNPRRMFGIWAEGMLPLCLNLLDAVGPPVAGEVGAFLNGFPQQLERANAALESREPTKFHPNAGAITLGIVQEAHALSLISIILRSDIARAAAEGIDIMAVTLDTAGGVLRSYDHVKVVEEAKGLARQKANLSARIVAASPVEEVWRARMVDAVDSVLSRKIIDEVEKLAGLSSDGEGEEGASR